MLLLPDRVSLFDEAAKLLAQVIRLFQFEMVNVVMRRNRIDAMKERLLVPVRQHQMSNNS